MIATEGEERFAAALQVISVPATHPQLAFVLAGDGRAPVRLRGRAGHRRPGPPAARGPRRRSRTRWATRRPPTATSLLRSLRPALTASATRFFDGLRSGAYDGHLEASTAVRLASLFRYAARHRAARRLPGRARPDRHAGGRRRRPHRRPHPGHRGAHPPGRRHQAPGQDRHRRHLPQRRDAAAAGRSCRPCSPPATARDRLTYKTLRTLADLDPAVAEVTGWIRYELDGDPEDGEVPVAVVDRGGIALDIPSRTERGRRLRGTKHTVALERQVFVTRGREDGRTIVIVPETKDDRATGITLLHVRFHDHLAVARRPRRAPGLPQPLGGAARRGARDRADLPRRPARRVPTADLLVAPIWPTWPTAGAAGRAGLDDRDRRRPLRGRPHARRRSSARRRCATRLFTDGEQAYCDRRKDPTERYAARFAAKEAVMKAMGARPRRVQVARDRGGAGAESGAPSVALHGGARRAGRGARHPRLAATMTHTHRVAEAIAVALAAP